MNKCFLKLFLILGCVLLLSGKCHDGDVKRQIDELKQYDYGVEFLERNSEENLERVILFLQDPEKYYHEIEKVPGLFSYIEVLTRFSVEKKKEHIFVSFMNRHFQVINDQKAAILTHLITKSTGGEYGEILADVYTKKFKDYHEKFIKVLKQTNNWKKVVNSLDAGNWNEFKDGLEKLSNSKFEVEFKKYVLAPRDEKGNRINKEKKTK